jgi:hypothetical protein
MSESTTLRLQAAIVAIAPAILLIGFAYHPYIADPTDKAAVAAALAEDSTRWGLSHLAVGVGSGLLALAFLAIASYLRDTEGARASALGLPFVILGSVIFAMLPAMEIGVMAAADAGADLEAAQNELDAWFVPVLVSGGVLFAFGVFGFAAAIRRSGPLGETLTWLVVAALLIMAVVRFIPLGAQFYVGGVAAVVALWPLAFTMWRQADLRLSSRTGPLPA